MADRAQRWVSSRVRATDRSPVPPEPLGSYTLPSPTRCRLPLYISPFIHRGNEGERSKKPCIRLGKCVPPSGTPRCDEGERWFLPTGPPVGKFGRTDP